MCERVYRTGRECECVHARAMCVGVCPWVRGRGASLLCASYVGECCAGRCTAACVDSIVLGAAIMAGVTVLAPRARAGQVELDMDMRGGRA